MKSVRWTAVAAAAVILLFLAALAAAVLSSHVPPDTGVPEEQPLPYRVVREWQGKVAVFLPAAEQPERVYETHLQQLPPGEQSRLREGISVADSRELKRLLEDYLS